MNAHRPLVLLSLLALAACGRSGGEPVYPGTIELDESDAAPLVGGRIVEMRVEEGDSVRPGDTLAILTQSSLPAAVEERRARLAMARARLADLQRGSRAPELARAEADLAAAEAEADRTAKDLVRVEPLAKGGVLPAQELDRATSAAQAAARRRDAARAVLELAREGSRSDQIRAAAAEVQSAEAQLKGASADLGELAVLAATGGVILSRHADPGEVVPSGTPVATIGETGRRWVRVYLPASLLARLPAGSHAEVSVAEATRPKDAPPPVEGRLGAVSSKAEYTPRAALTEEERADLLFASRVELLNPPSTFRPGLPVTVRFTPAGSP
ncbi:MAG TPA: HlyD family efflux transporter periplasmic adaptor subunit [Gemmatimonadales bacterium]|nr:HlyD family efflux transporter periplasmic adaptor subunit [Gemmatimonadales bacterium]